MAHLSNTEIFARIFTLRWMPFDEGARMAFADAGDDAQIAEDESGFTYVRSVTDGELLIEVLDAEGETVWMGTLAGGAQ